MFIDAGRCSLCMWLLESYDCMILYVCLLLVIRAIRAGYHWTYRSPEDQTSERGHGHGQVTFMCLHGMFIDTRWSKWKWTLFRISRWLLVQLKYSWGIEGTGSYRVFFLEPNENKLWIVWPLTNALNQRILGMPSLQIASARWCQPVAELPSGKLR